ncbi:MAG TPA: hypothetical protein VF572_05805 [Candidatus Saccharimonadales bacterium]|jgi:hypothetical protein
MALAEREVRQTTVADGNAVETTRQVANPAAEQDHKKDVVSRVVWFIAGVILTLLALRFILALLGANAASGFVDFIYGVTAPLVAPFFGVFGYTPVLGSSRFELYTLLAMAIYALVAYGISKLANITRRTA